MENSSLITFSGFGKKTTQKAETRKQERQTEQKDTNSMAMKFDVYVKFWCHIFYCP